MADETLTLVYRNGRLAPADALKRIGAGLGTRGTTFAGFELDGKQVALGQNGVPKLSGSLRDFDLAGPGPREFNLASVSRFRLDFLEIISALESRAGWDDWAHRLIDNDDFVMAWLADKQYEYWQNAADPLEYETEGRPYAHLPRVSNGLPYPLEQMNIDTSQNPGRRILRSGYIEVVGAVMWLGAPFWSLTKANQHEVSQTPWLVVSSPTPSVTRIEAAERCFTTDEDGSGELQSKLRSLLFPA